MKFDEFKKEVTKFCELLEADANDIDDIVGDQADCCDDRDEIEDDVNHETENVRSRASGIQDLLDELEIPDSTEVETLTEKVAELQAKIDDYEARERTRKADDELRAAGLIP